jgi:hypothetical protein
MKRGVECGKQVGVRIAKSVYWWQQVAGGLLRVER